MLLHDAGSADKIAQTIVEMVRADVASVPLDLCVFHPGPSALDAQFVRALPFEVRMLPGGTPEFQSLAAAGGFEYAVLFESSGMYRGEDLVGLCSQLVSGRLDAVWGSRRLSMRDIEASYAMRYEKNTVLGTISYIGSHVLSLAYLVFFGRYVADTLSGVRAVRAAEVSPSVVDLQRRDANHRLLAGLLRRKADVLEVPVRFVPMSPAQVVRTTVGDGLRALVTILECWWRRRAV